jgi:uncharacterized membrane protein YfcA
VVLEMSVVDALTIVVAAFFAGTINTIVGSGSLVTFPTLLALGYGPVVANVSNTVGLVFGSLSGAIGYRQELRGQRRRVLVLGPASFVGGLTGGILLLTLPGSVFRDVVPVLILAACGLMVAQPRLARWIAARRGEGAEHGGPGLYLGILATGVYGGYFGAAQGVILLALLGIFLVDDLQRLNGVKNVLAFVANGVAAGLFVLVADVDWAVAALIAFGAVLGGQVGARVGRRLPARWLRGAVVIIGVVAAVRLLA